MGSAQSNNFQYSVPLEGSKQKGYSHIYRNPLSKQALTQTPFPQIKTVKDIVISSCKEKFANKSLAGKINVDKTTEDGKQVQHRSIKQFTYKESFDIAQNLGKGIIHKKLDFQQSEHKMRFIGIFSKNRVQWLFVDMACVLFGLTSVPLYDTLGRQNLVYCLKQTQMTTLFATKDTLQILLKLQNHGDLKNIVLFDPITQEMKEEAKKHKLQLLSFEQLIQEGKQSNINHQSYKVSPNDCLTFSYTSGTTGPPKGAMLSHRNFTAFLSAMSNHAIKFLQTDSYLSFLPLPHVFQRVVVWGCVAFGVFITFYSGDILKVKDDCQVAKPTIFVAVPRLYNRIIQKVQHTFSETSGIKKCLVQSAVSSKLNKMEQNGSYNSFFYDATVFSKTRQQFGGKIRMMISGSAPLSQKSHRFMQMIMCAPLYQGYGQTENTAAAFITYPGQKQLSNVGGIVTSLQFKLADIPEMKYTSDDKDQNGNQTPRGEIWLRGPSVFMGYYKLKDKTKQAISQDGWLRTGDVGMLFGDKKAMKIIDRRKNIFKLQQGQYIAPEKVENIYSKSNLIDEIFLHGQSSQNFAVAIARLNQEHILELAKKNNIPGDYKQLCKSKDIKVHVLKDLNALGKASGLSGFQQAKNIYFSDKSFQEKGILTNTLKLQRFQGKVAFKSQIEALYKQGQIPLK